MDNGFPDAVSPDPAIIPEWIYCVYVCGFTFRFSSVAQIQRCLEFYSQKIQPSSRRQMPEEIYYLTHRGMFQRWYERLPLYLRKEGKRQQVVKALEKAIAQFADETALLRHRSPNSYRSLF